MYSNLNNGNDYKQSFLALAIVSTSFTVIVFCILFAVRKRIGLIILLYKETAKVFIAMPWLFMFPLLTLILQLLVIAFMATTNIYIGTSADLKRIGNSSYYAFEGNGVFVFTMVFNCVVTYWAIIFFYSCQYMILAGCVAHWYFQQNNFGNGLLTSFTNTIKFHLGTVAFGSFIITLVAVIKSTIRSLISWGKLKCLFDCICGNIEALLRFLSKMSFIETALYGKSFIRSSKRATRLLIANAENVIAINSVGDFVLALTQVLLLIISTAISYAIFKNNSSAWLHTIFSFIINFIIVVVVFSVFETTVDTIFVCLCEDVDMNDGSIEKPYKTTIGLKEFVDKSKDAFEKKKL